MKLPAEQLKDLLVVCDVDGTLLTRDKRLLQANLETVRLFTRLGGRFTVATGRTVGSVARYSALVKHLAPAITCGGAVIYDYAAEEVCQSATLPRVVARKVLADVRERFRKVGAAVVGNSGSFYVTASSGELYGLIDEERLTYFNRPEDNLPAEWNKLLFAADEKTLREVRAFVEGQEYPGVYFVATSPIYFEMMPEGVTKGSALRALCQKLEVPLRNTVVLGDYYNDVDIMGQAGYSVAMGNAPADIQLLADEVADSCDNGGVGQFLYKLIKHYGY